jgi:D-sedoheptulose 7-phosphate isomerase
MSDITASKGGRGTGAIPGSVVGDYIRLACEATVSVDAGEINRAAELCIGSMADGGTVFFCGNGGSAADSQHLAGELVGRFRMERKGLPAVALTANSAIITAVANDYDYTRVFSRQLEALGREGDVLVGISTSGNSENVLKAIEKAKEIGMATIGMTGSGGGALELLTDVCIKASAHETSHVQEALLIAGHALCHCIEIAMSAGEHLN